jgi:hypothetical protein
VLQLNKLDLKSFLNPYFLLIFSAMFLSTFSDQLITRKVEAIISSKDGLSNVIWAWAALSLFCTILFPLLTAMLSSFCIIRADKNLKKFVTENLELSFVETLRAWGKSFLWSFVFLLPGIRKFIHYTFTPHVVFFSKRYKAGEVDALAYSEQIAKKYWKPLNAWLTLYFLVVPVVFYLMFENYRLFSMYPLAATGLVLLKTVVEYCFNFSMLRILFKYLNETEYTTELTEVQNGVNV